MLAVSLLHIFPEVIIASQNAAIFFLGGFLMLYLFEEICTTHNHDHQHDDHIHEDPHEHTNHVAIIAFLAICLHTIFDGIGIRASQEISSTIGYSVLLGVAVHQIPVSLSLGAILQKSSLKKNLQILLMIVFASTIILGYFLADLILPIIGSEGALYATALAGGSLLYIATVDLLPITHSQSEKKL